MGDCLVALDGAADEPEGDWGKSGSRVSEPGPVWEDIRRMERMESISRWISSVVGCILVNAALSSSLNGRFGQKERVRLME